MSLVGTLRRKLEAALKPRTRRERQALALMAGIVAVAAWFQLLWTTHHERMRQTQVISDLQLRNENLKQVVTAMRDAKSLGKALRPIKQEHAAALISDLLRAAGVGSLSVVPDTQGQVRLAGIASFDAFLGWAAKAHGEYGIYVLRADFEPAGQEGMVKIDAAVALSGSP